MPGKYFADADASPRIRAEQIRALTGHKPIVSIGAAIDAAGAWIKA